MVRNKLRYYFLTYFLAIACGIVVCQPAGYYSGAEGLTGTSLQQALHDIIDNHSSVTYAQLWTSFQSTDKKSNGIVWDMYSDNPAGVPSYTFTFITDQCGNYSKEGDCYNREHSFPKSWFGGEVLPMYTDLFHLYPTDGYVNNRRDNYPFGETSSPTWTSTNGSKLGPSSYAGYTGVVFEPLNAYKGDFARSYFYMAVRYYGEDSGWPGSDMVTGSQPKTWALKMLMEWDAADPVSQKEKERNEAVYTIQGNRNPFIDNPAYVNQIWGTQTSVRDKSVSLSKLRIYPNPAVNYLTIDIPGDTPGEYLISVCDPTGRLVIRKSVSEMPFRLDVSGLPVGFYLITVSDTADIQCGRLVVSH
jgi:endonuclease I